MNSTASSLLSAKHDIVDDIVIAILSCEAQPRLCIELHCSSGAAVTVRCAMNKALKQRRPQARLMLFTGGGENYHGCEAFLAAVVSCLPPLSLGVLLPPSAVSDSRALSLSLALSLSRLLLRCGRHHE